MLTFILRLLSNIDSKVHKMRLRVKVVILVLCLISFLGLLIFLIQGHTVAVLDAKGIIAQKQKNLIIFTLLLSLVVIVPVFILLFTFAWRYRVQNTKATYKPNWEKQKTLEYIWWGFPVVIILILSVVTWRATHDLDPYKKIVSDKKPINVQVVALQWKWLFLYPDYGIASVNELNFPEKTPVDFKITADAPMNSFWIPQLGGQIYAMSGMQSSLSLMADGKGIYSGLSANLSGEGFAGMKFKAISQSDYDFNEWTQLIKATKPILDEEMYKQLAEPSRDLVPDYFTYDKDKLYDTILDKYMVHSGSLTEDSHSDYLMLKEMTH